MQVFFIVCLYLVAIGDTSIKKGRVGIPLFVPAINCCLSKPGHEVPTFYVVVFLHKCFFNIIHMIKVTKQLHNTCRISINYIRCLFSF